MDTENRLRTPWEMEKCDRWPSLYNVYDCDGNVVASCKIKEVAELITRAPDLQATIPGLLLAIKSILAPFIMDVVDE